MKQFKMKPKNKRFLSMLFGTSGARLLGNIWLGIGMNRAGKGFIRAGYGSSIKNKDF